MKDFWRGFGRAGMMVAAVYLAIMLFGVTVWALIHFAHWLVRTFPL